jgi:hypothetical protein
MTGTNEFTKKIKTKYSLNEAFSADKENSKAAQELSTDQNNSHTTLADVPQNIISMNTTQIEQSKKYTPQGSRYTKKMTLNITEEAYNKFHKIYATRLLNGRATEKGDLVGECIELLFMKEVQERHLII